MYQYFYWSELVNKYGKPVCGGAESTYWKMSAETGIKVMRTPFRLPNQEGHVVHLNRDALYLSLKWKETQRQYDLMLHLSKKGRCPKPISMAEVCDDRGVAAGMPYIYYPAIVMQHVNYEAYSYNGRKGGNKAVNKFITLLSKQITVCDAHGENIVFNKDTKKFMILDLGGVEMINK